LSDKSILDGITAYGDSMVDRATSGSKIYLMRHGRTALDMEKRSDGWLDLPLSDEGQRQLIESQQLLKQVPLKKIYTSSLQRVQETAHIVASGTLSKPKVVTNDDIKTWNLGVLAGTRKKYSRPEVKSLMDNPTGSPAGGEPYGEFVKRAIPAFTKIAAEAQKTGSPVLIVCSGSLLRCLGKMFLYNEDAIDLDEGGLACMSPLPYGGYTGEVIHGGEPRDDEYESA
jgi:broad specificity phosphatase PhoE